MSVKPIPDGYHAVTPYLIVDEAARAIDFYQRVFGAVEVMRMAGPDGKIGHAEIKIGDSHVMLADEHEEVQALSAKTIGGSPVSLLVYVPDVDTVFVKAIAAGAKVQRPLEDKFYGDRMATIVDPFGHIWNIATHIRDVSPEEMERMAKEMGT